VEEPDARHPCDRGRRELPGSQPDEAPPSYGFADRKRDTVAWWMRYVLATARVLSPARACWSLSALSFAALTITVRVEVLVRPEWAVSAQTIE